MKIVFMGTPAFAVHILDAIIKDAANEVLSVITAPDKPAGRGQHLHESEVKKYALANDLPLLQPSNLKDLGFQTELAALKADLFVVVAFRMLPEAVWAMPPKGTINLHASLLPNYRGAAPINWAVINGEQKTGVSTFFIEKEIDTGKVIEQATIEIGVNDTAGEVHDRLMELGGEVTVSTIHKIASGDVAGIAQNEMLNVNLKLAPKIFRTDCKIDWSKSVRDVHNHIRGLSPYPAPWTLMVNQHGEEKVFKIGATEITDIPIINSFEVTKNADGLLFPSGDYYILVKNIQPEGKRMMDYKAFLAGNKLEDWKLVL
ncbi:MAG: methionyl-tRNA formyltransferase [Bacteroidota bacterium]